VPGEVPPSDGQREGCTRKSAVGRGLFWACSAGLNGGGLTTLPRGSHSHCSWTGTKTETARSVSCRTTRGLPPADSTTLGPGFAELRRARDHARWPRRACTLRGPASHLTPSDGPPPAIGCAATRIRMVDPAGPLEVGRTARRDQEGFQSVTTVRALPRSIVPDAYSCHYLSGSTLKGAPLLDAAGQPLTPGEVVAAALDANLLAPVFVHRCDDRSVARMTGRLSREANRRGVRLHIRVVDNECVAVFATIRPGPDQVRRAMDHPGGI
jgi:hypothetical protein